MSKRNTRLAVSDLTLKKNRLLAAHLTALAARLNIPVPVTAAGATEIAVGYLHYMLADMQVVPPQLEKFMSTQDDK